MILPPAYCISMLSTPTRIAHAAAEFNRVGLPYKFHFGFTGTDAGVCASIPIEGSKDGAVIPPGMVSANISHITVWHHLHLSGTKEALIFEDDVLLPDDFMEQFEQCYNELPKDWQFVFLGHCCGEDKPKTQLSSRIWEIKWPMCLHAYMVKYSALATMIRTTEKINTPLDIQLQWWALPKLRTYCFVPGIADQQSYLGQIPRAYPAAMMPDSNLLPKVESP